MRITNKLLKEVIAGMKAAHPRAIEAFKAWNKGRDEDTCPVTIIQGWEDDHSNYHRGLCDMFCRKLFPVINISSDEYGFECPCRYTEDHDDLTKADISRACDRLAAQIEKEGL